MWEAYVSICSKRATQSKQQVYTVFNLLYCSQWNMKKFNNSNKQRCLRTRELNKWIFFGNPLHHLCVPPLIPSLCFFHPLSPALAESSKAVCLEIKVNKSITFLRIFFLSKWLITCITCNSGSSHQGAILHFCRLSNNICMTQGQNTKFIL